MRWMICKVNVFVLLGSTNYDNHWSDWTSRSIPSVPLMMLHDCIVYTIHCYILWVWVYQYINLSYVCTLVFYCHLFLAVEVWLALAFDWALNEINTPVIWDCKVFLPPYKTLVGKLGGTQGIDTSEYRSKSRYNKGLSYAANSAKKKREAYKVYSYCCCRSYALTI